MVLTVEAPVRKAPVREVPAETQRTPEEELWFLEKEALGLGMSPQEFGEIKAIGTCHVQVLERIAQLQRWIADHD